MGTVAAEILLERLNGRSKDSIGIKRIILSQRLLLKGSEKLKL